MEVRTETRKQSYMEMIQPLSPIGRETEHGENNAQANTGKKQTDFASGPNALNNLGL